MLKYTLGALAAFAILLVTAFVIIARVTDSNAGVGPARAMTFVMHGDHFSPDMVEVDRGQIYDMRFENAGSEVRTVVVGGKGVEILPQISTIHEEPTVSDIRSSVAVVVEPLHSRSILVRFTQSGDYQAGAYLTGTYQLLFSSKIVVK